MAVTYGVSTVNTANAWLNVLKGTTFTGITNPLYVELHTDGTTADPSGTANVSAGSTTRNATTIGTASGGSISPSSLPSAWTNGGTSENLKYIALWSAATSGTFYMSIQLTSTQAWASGNTFTLTSLSVSISPLAA